MTPLLHLAYSLSLLAFLVRDILWLRIMAIASHLCFFAVVYARPPAPDWTILGWFLVFLLINSTHAARLVYERRLDRLSPEEERLREISFPALNKVSVKRLLRLGHWETLSAGVQLTLEHQVPARMYLLAEGEVEVKVGGRKVAMLEPGHFVGEMALLAGQAASATASARTSVRCLVWDRASLDRRLGRDNDLRSTLYAAAGSNLSKKIAVQNLEFRSAFGDQAPPDDRAVPDTT
jgi:CRP-like cAMP-binding protein